VATQDELEIALTGHKFRQPELLQLALTHSSLAYEDNVARGRDAAPSPAEDNEQLEFVGDAVLGLIAAEELYKRFPHLREGDLTRLRSSIVSRKHLAERAAALNLGEHLRLGKGEERTGGRRKPALLSNAMEALVAAVYIDGGLSAAAKFVMHAIIEPAMPELMSAAVDGAAIGDWKSALQEHVQERGLGLARYTVTAESGPDHEKSFSVQVQLEGTNEVLGSATATTKKAAQQRAAQEAMQLLRGREAHSHEGKR